MAINALGFLGLAFARSYPWALASVVLAGVGGAFYHPAATAMIARLFPEARGRALGLVGIGASIGFFLGTLYSGWRAVLSGSWRVPVGELGVLGLVTALLFAWLADEERSTPTADTLSTGPTNLPRESLFPNGTTWLFFLAACLFFSLRDFAGSAMATSASLFFQTAHGFDPKVAGAALSGIFLTAAVSNPLFGRLSDSGRVRWMSLVLLMAAMLMALFPRVPVVWMVPVLLGYGFFFMASYPISEAALMEAVHDSVRGRIFGLFITLCGLVGNLSHWLIGDWVTRLGERASLPSSFFPLYSTLSLLVLCSLAAMPFLEAIRKREHKLAPGKSAPPASTPLGTR